MTRSNELDLIYWLFIHFNLWLSKTAGDVDSRSGSNISMNSSRVKISSSPTGDQPSNVMKLNKASGK